MRDEVEALAWEAATEQTDCDWVSRGTALRTNTALLTLRLAHQHAVISHEAEQRLAASVEPNRTLLSLGVELRSVNARQLLERYLRRNVDERRKQRRASEALSPCEPSCGHHAGWVGDGSGRRVRRAKQCGRAIVCVGARVARARERAHYVPLKGS